MTVRSTTDTSYTSPTSRRSRYNKKSPILNSIHNNTMGWYTCNIKICHSLRGVVAIIRGLTRETTPAGNIYQTCTRIEAASMAALLVQ